MSDFLGGLFNQPSTYPAPAAKPKPEKGVQLRGKHLDGEFYIRATDVVALLEINALLPDTVQRLKRATET